MLTGVAPHNLWFLIATDLLGFTSFQVFYSFSIRELCQYRCFTTTHCVSSCHPMCLTATHKGGLMLFQVSHFSLLGCLHVVKGVPLLLTWEWRRDAVFALSEMSHCHSLGWLCVISDV